MKVLEHKNNKSSSCVYRSGGIWIFLLLSLSARCLLFIFSPAFLCRCGEQPTSAGFFFFFFQATQFETKAKYTGPFIKPRHGEERESRKRGRDSKMTISLFFLTLISLEDKWNHMLAVVLGEKTKQQKKKRGNFQDSAQDREEQKGQIDLIKVHFLCIITATQSYRL